MQLYESIKANLDILLWQSALGVHTFSGPSFMLNVNTLIWRNMHVPA